MKKAFLILGLLAFPVSAFAQEGYPPECRFVPEHKPSAEVAYQPGVDVNGKPVVPADANSAAPMDMTSQTIVVPLTVDLAQRLQGLNVPGLEMEGTLGFLEIAPGGRITYNGQDLTGEVQVLCDPKTGKNPQNAAPAPVGANGQGKHDAVKYAPTKEATPAPKAAPPKPVTYLKAPEPAATVPAPKPPEAEKGELLKGADYGQESEE